MKVALIIFMVLAGIASLISITIAVMDFIHTIKERRAAKKNSTPDEK